MTAITNIKTLDSVVRKAVADATVTDMHTHLFPPAHEGLLLWGIDEMLTYHYLVSELFTTAPRDLTPAKFQALPKREQADIVGRRVFLERGALSESARGVVGTLSALGLDPATRNLATVRKWFARQKVERYAEKVFDLAGIDYAVMTNDPFVLAEAKCWDARLRVWDRLKTALRIDPLIVNWPAASAAMRSAGYATAGEPDEKSCAEARRFLRGWATRLGSPVYMAASLPPDFAYPEGGRPAEIVRDVVLPAARELGLPVALMIGVRRRVNPALGDAGDAVGVADVGAVRNLCAENPDVKFLVTVLSLVNQHELCGCAMKFGNLHVFGCWWFVNTPGMIEQITRMRLELLGTNFTANHSDARVLDQLLYKWDHTRAVVADVLAEAYAAQFAAGWRPTRQEIATQARALLGGMYEEFLAK